MSPTESEGSGKCILPCGNVDSIEFCGCASIVLSAVDAVTSEKHIAVDSILIQWSQIVIEKSTMPTQKQSAH